MLRSRGKLFYALMLASGCLAGVAGFLVYISNAASYLSDEPKTCVNCHVMGPYYASYAHSSHALVATCNDCHVPHDNIVKKYAFKAQDGLYHSTIFTLRAEPQVIRIKEAGANVVQANCERCHNHLNEKVTTTGTTLVSRSHGEGRFCWDCHREVPHGTRNSLSATPDARVPYPASPVPDWLRELQTRPTVPPAASISSDSQHPSSSP